VTPEALLDCDALRSRWNAVNAGRSRGDPAYLPARKFAMISIARGGTGKEKWTTTWYDMKNGLREVNDHAKLVAAIVFDQQPQHLGRWGFPELTALPPDIGRALQAMTPEAQAELFALLRRLLQAKPAVREKALHALEPVLRPR
jgi:hypothetical protein